MRIPSKNTNFRLESGDYLSFETPGAGGYGNPLERDINRIKDDLKQGYITKEAAERDYGIKLD
jgi:N-methylhydantoinase B/oxoprolinase/acetone carboxylase alpha subunit